MSAVRTFEVDDCAMDLLVEAKQGRTISVCIPCRDEAATIGPLVSMVRHALIRRIPLVDELLVLDDRSTDDTAAVAASAGATAVSYTHLRAHETVLDLVCRLLLEKKKSNYTPIQNTSRNIL